MKKIVFQGDSITDSCKGRGDKWHLGYGYADMVAGKVSFKYPGEFEFINHGISGNRSADMYARCATETLLAEPDYLSILIGVNDIWRGVDSGVAPDPDRYEQLLSMFVEDVFKIKPDAKIAILEPFVLDGAATHDNIDEFVNGVAILAKRAKNVADKYNLIFIPLQEKFSQKAAETDPGNWLIDGVHPTQAGHELIAREWIEAFGL